MTATQRTAHDLPQHSSETTISSDLQDQIRTRAYEIYEHRGRHHGFAEQDWLEAEAEILVKANASGEVRVSATAREKAVAFIDSRRQAALSRAARSAEKARPDRAGV
jgi:Protein of unknown function (DUF2934)